MQMLSFINISTPLQPCPDVFWFPMVTPVFCKHLIEEMEHLNQWSGGTHEVGRYLSHFTLLIVTVMLLWGSYGKIIQTV